MKARTRRKPARPLRSEPPEGGNARPARLIARETADQTLAIGLRRPWFGDLYHFMLRISWCSFLLGGVALYIAANAGFALLYLLQPGAIGYGQLVPATLYANLLVTLETASGLMFLAIATGLVFARFSRPTARLLFSRVAVIGPHNGKPTLALRLANQRRNQILQAEVAATLVRDERTAEGVLIRRFYDLTLARTRSPVFALTFTVMHEIDRDSPLYGATAASLTAENAELVVTASGIDEVIAQRVHVRTSYLPDEILWGRRFVDVIGWTEDGSCVIDYRRFHDTVALRAAP